MAAPNASVMKPLHFGTLGESYCVIEEQPGIGGNTLSFGYNGEPVYALTPPGAGAFPGDARTFSYLL